MKAHPLSLADTKKMAENLLETVAGGGAAGNGSDLGHKNGKPREGALVVGLYGDLGSGKTTFMQFFGVSLGVKEKMLSPTFVIEKIYKIEHPKFDHLIHIDAYRIEDPKEMLTLGWKEIVSNPRNIICVEWADKIAELLPKGTVSLHFSHHDESSRLISLNQEQR